MKLIPSLAVVLAIATTAQACPFFMSLDEANNCVFDPLRALSSNLEDIEKGLKREKRQAETDCPFCANGVVMLYPDWSDRTCSSFYLCFGGVNTRFICDASRPFYNPTTKACEPIINPSNVCFYRSFIS